MSINQNKIFVSGRYVGSVRENTFYKTVTRENHFVWKYKGYGINALKVETLHADGIVNISIKERDTGNEYLTTVKEYIENGIRDQLGKCEPQIFLPCSSMSEIKPIDIKSKALKASEVRYEPAIKPRIRNERRIPAQLSFLG